MSNEPPSISGTRPVIDSTVMRIPDALNPMVDGVLVVNRLRPLHDVLTERARQMLVAQNPGNVLRETEWTIATTPEQAADWSLPHDCDDCREGRDMAVAALTAEPDRPIALGVLYYDEPPMAEGPPFIRDERWLALVDEWVAHDRSHAADDPPCDVCLDIDRRMSEVDRG